MSDDAKFVVIGKAVSYAGVPRTWLHSLEAGIQHAKNLLTQKRQPPGTELLVVKVVAKVRVLDPEPPIVVEIVE